MGDGDKFFPTEYLTIDNYEKIRGRQSFAFWLVGNSGSGKSTLAKSVEKMLYDTNYAVKCLDGDNLRSTLNSDLDLTINSRTEHIRRCAEVSKMFLENGISTINCFISPTEEMRNYAKKILGNKFLLIYIKASDEEVKKRDVKKLYKSDAKNMDKSLNMFEIPSNPDLIIDTTNRSVKYSANILFNFIINQPR